MEFLLKLACWPDYVSVRGKTGLLDQFRTIGVRSKDFKHGAAAMLMDELSFLEEIVLVLALKRYVIDNPAKCVMSQYSDVTPKRVECKLLSYTITEEV